MLNPPVSTAPMSSILIFAAAFDIYTGLTGNYLTRFKRFPLHWGKAAGLREFPFQRRGETVAEIVSVTGVADDAAGSFIDMTVIGARLYLIERQAERWDGIVNLFHLFIGAADTTVRSCRTYILRMSPRNPSSENPFRALHHAERRADGRMRRRRRL